MKSMFDFLLFVKSSNSNLAKFIRYALIGGSAALLDFCVFFLCFKLLSAVLQVPSFSIPNAIFIANTAGILSGFVWGFFMQKKWAFQAKGNTQAQFLYMTCLLIFNIVISSMAIFPLSWLLNGNVAIAKVIMQVVVVLWNYLIYNYIIFKDVGVVDER